MQVWYRDAPMFGGGLWDWLSIANKHHHLAIYS